MVKDFRIALRSAGRGCEQQKLAHHYFYSHRDLGIGAFPRSMFLSRRRQYLTVFSHPLESRRDRLLSHQCVLLEKRGGGGNCPFCLLHPPGYTTEPELILHLIVCKLYVNINEEFFITTRERERDAFNLDLIVGLHTPTSLRCMTQLHIPSHLHPGCLQLSHLCRTAPWTCILFVKRSWHRSSSGQNRLPLPLPWTRSPI